MNIKQIPPWYREAIIVIFGYVSITAIMLIVMFKPWKIQKDTDSILPPLESPIMKEDKQINTYYDNDTVRLVEELVERVERLENQIQQLIVEEKKSESKKKKWLRFSSTK